MSPARLSLHIESASSFPEVVNAVLAILQVAVGKNSKLLSKNLLMIIKDYGSPLVPLNVH